MTATDEMFHHFACHPATSTAFVQPLLLCLTLSVSRLSRLTVSMFSLASTVVEPARQVWSVKL